MQLVPGDHSSAEVLAPSPPTSSSPGEQSWVKLVMREESQVVLAVRQEGKVVEAAAAWSRRRRRRGAMVGSQLTECVGRQGAFIGGNVQNVR